MVNMIRMQPILILGSALVGVLLGQIAFFENNSEPFIEPFLIVMLFFTFLIIDLKQIVRSFYNVRFTTSSLMINFIWVPIFAFLLGILFFEGNIDARIGLMMLLVAPCTDWYLVFIGLSKGNVPLGASILPLNLILQMILLPLFLLIFLGSGVSLDTSSLLMSVILMLIIPLVAANAMRYSLKNTRFWPSTEKILSKHGDNLQVTFLCLAIIAMFASQSRALTNNPEVFLEMLIPLGLFFTINFCMAQYVGRKLKMEFDDIKALTMTVLARNAPIALAIAVVAFPNDPLIALILVIGPLIELPILTLASKLLLKMGEKQKTTDTS